MKEEEVSVNQSKKIKPDKASLSEVFIAMWMVRWQLGHTSVRDENCKLHPVHHLFMVTEGYIPQTSDNISAESSGGHSLGNFRVFKLLHTRLSWEAMGIAKGKLPGTIKIGQHGNEMHAWMTMNGIFLDEHFPEFRIRNSTRRIIMFSP